MASFVGAEMDGRGAVGVRDPSGTWEGNVLALESRGFTFRRFEPTAKQRRDLGPNNLVATSPMRLSERERIARAFLAPLSHAAIIA